MPTVTLKVAARTTTIRLTCETARLATTVGADLVGTAYHRTPATVGVVALQVPTRTAAFGLPFSAGRLTSPEEANLSNATHLPTSAAMCAVALDVLA